MRLEIVTPDKHLYDGKINLIRIPGTKGSFAILKNHAPIISTLEPGRIKIIAKDGGVQFLDIEGGIVECYNNHVIVLVESA